MNLSDGHTSDNSNIKSMETTVFRARKSHSDLARQIVDFARRQDFKKGKHLPEQRLADEFGVSRSLVRSALKLLANHDIVKSSRGQGFFLTVSANAPNAQVIELPAAPEERIYAAVTRDRFSHRISENVTITQLMRGYGASRTMIIKVLGRMEKEGLIDRGPGSRWRFRPALNTPKAYEESYRFRLLIEPAAILEPGFLIAPARFQQIRRAHEHLIAGAVYTLDPGRLFEIDALFHETLGACSGNRFLAQIIRQQNHIRRLSDYASYDNRARLRESCREHVSILDAIESGDRDRAAKLMRDHITLSRDIRPTFAGDLSKPPYGTACPVGG